MKTVCKPGGWSCYETDRRGRDRFRGDSMTAGWKNQNKGRVTTRTLKEPSRRGQEMSWVFNFLLEEEQEPRRPLVQTSEVSASKL